MGCVTTFSRCVHAQTNNSMNITPPVAVASCTTTSLLTGQRHGLRDNLLPGAVLDAFRMCDWLQLLWSEVE
jgi:hypothetical protein